MKISWTFFLILFISSPVAAQTKGRVLEEIIARVNNDIITLSDFQRAQNSLHEEARQECPNCSPQQLQVALADKEKNLLRDLIDQSLLVQRAKDLGISVEAGVVKRLDQIRQQNKLASMEDLEKAVSSSGTSFEDFKNNIRNGLLTQELIRREVGSRIIIDHEEIQKYYDEHKSEFQRPEQVYLREMFVSTEGKKEAEIPELEKKARNLLERVKKGEDFAELAKRYSDGSTAKSGGELGVFERGQLAKEYEGVVFKMSKGQVTDVIRTKTGFLFLKVEQRFEAGLQPVDKVEGEITNRLYAEKMEPALRSYLQTLREESYVVVKPAYVDTAAVASSPIEEVAAAPEAGKPKKGKRSFPLIGKRKKEGQ
jgi:peptidyl-prolyl cis-trans isomerase SurA